MMKKIAVIYMGGTFGCIGAPLAPMPAQLFIPKLQSLCKPLSHVEFFVAPAIVDSSACTPKDWLQLIQMIHRLRTAQYQHFIIIHGTDTLSYASAVLSHFIAPQLSIILTGSQLPLLDEQGIKLHTHSDAWNNLNYAIEQIDQVNHGVYIGFNRQLIPARTALKFHTTDFDAFKSTFPTLQFADTLQPPLHIDEALLQKATQFSCLSLMLQPIEMDQLTAQLRTLLDRPPHVLILQGFGIGNIAANTAFSALLEQFYAKNCAVILTTQVPFGSLDQRYAVNEWVAKSKVLISNCYSHADLYAKSLKMYLQYDDIDQWYQHWNSEFI